MDALRTLKAEANGEKLASWDSILTLWPHQPSSSKLNIIVKVLNGECEQYFVRLSLLTRIFLKNLLVTSS